MSKLSQASTTVEKDVADLKNFKKEYELNTQGKAFVSEDKVDAKVQKVLESLKNNNEFIWKESLALAEQQFNSKGIEDTVSLIPRQI